MVDRDVFGKLILAGIISTVCGVFGWVGLIFPEWLGWSPETPLLVKGSLFVLGCMPLLWFFSFRLHLRSVWVYQNTKPITMYLQVQVKEDSDGKSYYALLRSDQYSQEFQQIPVYPPRWDISSMESIVPVAVFVDPASAKPMVIENDGKRLWTLAL
jgi:hypothetical protein